MKLCIVTLWVSIQPYAVRAKSRSYLSKNPIIIFVTSSVRGGIFITIFVVVDGLTQLFNHSLGVLAALGANTPSTLGYCR